MTQVKDILDCPCLPVLEEDIYEFFDRHLNKKGFTVAINAEKILRYSSDLELKTIIDNSFLPYPDGAGAVLGLSWLHGKKSEKINMPIIALNYANNNSLKTFIVGSDQNNHDIAINNIKEEYQNINLVGNLHGFHDPDYIYNEISIKQPDIILLAMGSPLQEKFALNLINYLDTGIIIGCGGALDIIAGKLKRAPSFWINNNLEWLYRVIQEPWRYKRQLFLPKFFISLIYAVCKKKLKTFLEKRF